MSKKFDFSGYATKNDLKCSDGRTIRKDAFKHYDGKTVPLVWQHFHNDPDNILGHAVLENRPDGVYAYCSFNENPKAESAKKAIKHGDINSLSIFANRLKQDANKNVMHGEIRELSLVIAGANDGAKIDNVSMAHNDGSFVEAEDEIVIQHSVIFDDYEGGELEMEHADDDVDPNFDLEAAYNSMNPDQKMATSIIAAYASDEAGKSAKHDGLADDDDPEVTGEGDKKDMPGVKRVIKHNAFQDQGDFNADDSVLSHDDLKAFATAVFEDLSQNGGTFKKAFIAHAADHGLDASELMHADGDYGIKAIEILFPDAKVANGQTPTFIKRRTAWVNDFLTKTQHLPFSRIKTRTADITEDEARAKGYIKGNQKFEEVFSVAQRETYPQTVYKKQKLDNDDIIDITDFDIVAWLWAEMRFMIEEEIARAGLVGDGRVVGHRDKIQENKIRPIWNDDDLYTEKFEIVPEADGTFDPEKIIDTVIRSFVHYEGSGGCTMYTTAETTIDMQLVKDKIGRKLYPTQADLLATLRVSSIAEVPVMKGVKGTVKLPDANGDLVDTEVYLHAVIVNPNDYAYGSTKGGELTNHSDFDIDYNQHKYLIETRLSGALLNPKTAISIVSRVTPLAQG